MPLRTDRERALRHLIKGRRRRTPDEEKRWQARLDEMRRRSRTIELCACIGPDCFEENGCWIERNRPRETSL